MSSADELPEYWHKVRPQHGHIQGSGQGGQGGQEDVLTQREKKQGAWYLESISTLVRSTLFPTFTIIPPVGLSLLRYSCPMTIKLSQTLSNDDRAAIKTAAGDLLPDAVQLLKDLTGIDTTNPPSLNYSQIAYVLDKFLLSKGYEVE
ncbi:hypothetical protein B0J17DRAFT_717674 [Rhizoctonia solani]|nr:hypothetical protein B0J17DRAFT_717674 [Rhizoctonia solani]